VDCAGCAVTEVVTIGDATLYLGDCMEVLPTLGRFDLLCTDPPYGIGFAAQPGNYRRKAGQLPEDWDGSAPPDWLFGLMRDKAIQHIIWGGNYYPLPPMRGWLSWFKPDGPPSYGHFELAWTSLDMVCRQFERSRGGEKRDQEAHPTQKPLSLMLWCIELADSPQTILDPFMGSGTTGVACVQLGRKFTGIERERKYFDIACERISRAQAQGQMFPPEHVKQVQETFL
jgi:site-specific DNA-methyltransferase (adenine-specific)